MTQPTTITIDSVRYVREDSIQERHELGGREVVVLDKGFIFVGNAEEAEGGLWIRNASNVRRWEKGGFGGMVRDPKAAGVTLDESGDLFVPTHAIQQRHPVAAGWGQ